MPPTSPALLKTFTTRPDQTGCPATLIACGFKITRMRRLRRHVLDSTTHDLPHRIEWQLAGFVGSPADMFTVTAAHAIWSNTFDAITKQGSLHPIARARLMFCTRDSLRSSAPIVLLRGSDFSFVRCATRPLPGAENILPFSAANSFGELASPELAAAALALGHELIGYNGETQTALLRERPDAIAPIKLLRAFLTDESLIAKNDLSPAAILCAALINAPRLVDYVKQAPELSSLHAADPASRPSRAALLPTKGSSQRAQDRVAQHLGL